MTPRSRTVFSHAGATRLITPTALALVVGGAALALSGEATAIVLDRLPRALEHEIREESHAERTREPEAARAAFDAKRRARVDAGAGRDVPAPDALVRGVRGRLDALQAARAHGSDARTIRFLRSTEAVEALARLRSESGPALRLVWDEASGTPRFMAGVVRSTAGPPTEETLDFLHEARALFAITDARAELEVTRVVESDEGVSGVRVQQVFRRLEVFGHDAVVRFDGSGRIIGFSGRLRPTPEVSIEPALSASEARARATAALSARDRVTAAATSADLAILVHDGAPRLAWKVLAEAGLAYRREAFIDASSGELLRDITLVAHGERALAAAGEHALHGTIHRRGGAPSVGQGVDLAGQTQTLQLWNESGTHFMINTTKPMFDAGLSNMPDDPRGAVFLINANNGDGSSLLHVTSTNPNDWTGLANAVSAATSAGLVYDYYDDRHARDSIDGNGMTMNLVVNFQQNFNNAFWNGQFMVFGNGDGNAFSDLAGALDVTAHEMSHGVIEHSANLVYEFQPGALNEHFADVFGVSTEFFVRGAGGNWLLGEEVTTPGTPGDALRDMENPDGPLVAFGPQPAHMDDFQDLPASQDNGGVHINSGIPNRAFFLASTGASMTVEKTERIWYRALTLYLTRESQFIDFRLALLQATDDLFAGAEIAAVEAALDAVGIFDGEGTGGGDDPLPDNTGTDYLAVVDPTNGHVIRTIVPFDKSDLVDLSQAAVGESGRPSFSDDGSICAWVGDDNNVYLSLFDGTNTVPLSDDSNWWSVALSADAALLAATTVAADGSIYVFDLVGSDDAVYELTTQNSTDGSVPDNVEFADVMEFTVVGDHVLYDALNTTTFDGKSIGYWDINVLRLSDGETFRVFQPLPRTESIGNPTFAQNNDDIMAFDYLTDSGDILVMGFNFNSNTIGQLTNNFTSVGRPTFAGDDGSVYYHFFDEFNADVWNVQLESDGVTGIPATDQQYLLGALFPVHFTRGTRPTPVLVESMAASWRGARVTLEWRVPDPSAYEGFHVERGSAIGDGFERRTERLVPPGAGGEQRFVDGAPDDGRTRVVYRIVGLARDGASIELGRLDVIAGAAPGAGVATLLPVRPNPVGGTAALGFTLHETVGAERVMLSVYDVTGRLVARPFDATEVSAGLRAFTWDGRDTRGARLAPGTYFVHLDVGAERSARKLTLLP